jgi:hypothetical protein
MLHVHVIMSASTLLCHVNFITVLITASLDWLTSAVVHLCSSARPQYLARERGQ